MNRFKGLWLIVALALIGFIGSGVMAADEKKKKRDPEAIFKKLDKNSDGKLSLEEYLGKRKDDAEKAKKGTAKFKKLDTNSDGAVTLEEFKAGGKKKKKDG